MRRILPALAPALALLAILGQAPSNVRLNAPEPVLSSWACEDTHVAASHSNADVQSAVNAADDGDCVTVPAGDGDVTWTSAVTVSAKNIQVVGPGAGSLTVRDFAVNLTDSGSRVTGFTFLIGSNQIQVNWSQGFRYDHNTITATEWHICFNFVGGEANTRSSVGNEGVLDHNTINDCRFVSYGEDGTTGGSDRWLATDAAGTVHTVYLEDNTYTIINCPQEPSYPNCLADCGILCNFADANYGGSYVLRYNTVVDSYIEGHPTSGSVRGMRFAEVYGNAFSIPTARRRTGFAHVGVFFTGQLLIFNNTSAHAFSAADEPNRIDVSWHDGDNRGAMGACNGSNFVDSNEMGSGWLCRDQPGSSYDAFYWRFPDGAPAPAQVKAPLYVWNNPFPSEDVWIKSSDTTRIATGRDFFPSASGEQTTSSSPFNGTVGTGWGTIARRPSTCTTGVGYWASDEGEWNSTNGSAADGRLYRCTSTDTWTVYYTPYTYPHPLAQ